LRWVHSGPFLLEKIKSELIIMCLDLRKRVVKFLFDIFVPSKCLKQCCKFSTSKLFCLIFTFKNVWPQLFYALNWPPTLQFFEDLYPKIRLFQASSMKKVFSHKSSTKIVIMQHNVRKFLAKLFRTILH
jgi:hypothetical protein